MADYWMTFRIEGRTVDGETDDDRRNALYDAVDRISSGWWVEPTSFVLFDSDKTIGNVALACKNAIATDYDIVLIRELDTKDARVVGNVAYWETLKAYMPYVSKV